MIQDEILRMAIQCQLVNTNNRTGIYVDALHEFAKLVAQHERNEIIEILDVSTGYVHMDSIRERT